MSMRRYSYVAVLLIIFVCVLYVAAQRRSADERQRLISDLQEAGITVDAKNTPTETLRLQWFTEINRIDPIFAIEGTDPAQLREALSILYTKETDFTAYYHPASQQETIVSALYPTGFLNLLPDLEQQRTGFLAHPSPESAAQYQSLLTRTVYAYTADITSLSYHIQVSTSTAATIAFVGQSTDIATFTRTLDALAQDAREQNVKAFRRFSCLSFYASGCESIGTLLINRAISITVPQATTPPDKSMYAMDGLLATINAQMWPAYSTRPLPPIIAEHSDCYPYPTTYIRTWWQTLPEGGDAHKMSITNDIYFNNITPDQNSIYSQTFAQGARYKYQISGHYYMCADSGIDVSRTNAALSVYSLLKEQPIFSTTTDPSLADLKRRENAIRSGTYIDEHGVAEYVRAAATLIALRGYSSLDDEIGADRADRLEHLITLWRGGSSDFDEIVREAAFESEFMSLFEKKNHLPVFSLLFTRSYASVLFLTGNTTFIEQPLSFAKEVRSYPLASFGMSSFHDLRRAGSTTRELVTAVVKTAHIEKKILP